MSETSESSDGRRITAAVLILLGRLTFAIATVYALTHFIFGRPPQLWRIGVGFAAATALLLGAASLLRDFRWLWQIPVISLTLAGLVIGGFMVRLYFAREPHQLNSTESWIAAVGLVAFAGGVVLLRLRRKLSGHA